VSKLKLKEVMINNILKLEVTVTAKFIDANTLSPLKGSNYEFQLFDEDLIKDEFLGSCFVNSKGEAKLSFDLRQLKSFDSPFETRPDLYFNLYERDKEIYKSETFKNIHLNRYGELSGEHGYALNLGTYVMK
jgi:hypothetical protein